LKEERTSDPEVPAGSPFAPACKLGASPTRKRQAAANRTSLRSASLPLRLIIVRAKLVLSSLTLADATPQALIEIKRDTLSAPADVPPDVEGSIGEAPVRCVEQARSRTGRSRSRTTPTTRYVTSEHACESANFAANRAGRASSCAERRSSRPPGVCTSDEPTPIRNQIASRPASEALSTAGSHTNDHHATARQNRPLAFNAAGHNMRTSTPAG
jgi:hypothetical protein